MVDNHMITREDSPTIQELERRVMRYSSAVGLLEHVEGMIVELSLDADFAIMARKWLNTYIIRLDEAETSFRSHPDFHSLRNGDYDYRDFAIDLSRHHSVKFK